MVYPLGLTASEVEAFEAAGRAPHRMRTRIELQDLSHRRVATLSSDRVGGSVAIVADSDESTRQATLELHDPTDMLGLGNGSQAAPPNRMIQLWRGRFIQTGTARTNSPYGSGIYGVGVYGAGLATGPSRTVPVGHWIDVPVFCGPISKPSRSNDTLSIEALDKVALAVKRSTGPATVRVTAGTNCATAIRQVMQAVTGETRFRLSSTSRRLTRSHTVNRDQNAWQLVQRICRALGWVCFYDGAGYLVCKPRPTTPVTHFRPGLGGSLTSGVSTGYWDGEIRNQVTVIGGVISKTTITATTTLPASHPLSPENLATGSGARQFLTEYVEDSGISTYADALALSAQRLRELSIQQSTAAFEAVHMEHLQEHDPYTVQTAAGSIAARLSESTIQLGHEGGQSFGYLASSPRQGRGLRVRPKSARLKRAEQVVRAKKKGR